MLLTTLVSLLSLTSLVAASPVAQAAAPAAAVEKRGFSFSAPHYSLYINDLISYDAWPLADKIKPYNRVLLAFWESKGAQAAPASWQGFTDAQRAAIVQNYHDNGIAIMVSAFSDDDHIVSNKADPVATAQAIGAWVKKYNVDGVDIDYEDFAPLQNDQANALSWLTSFHNELANQLPLSQYAISSTPSAWMYGSSFGGVNSVYCKLQGAVGSKISWYNFQLYNGQPGAWNTCENTYWNSANPAFLSVNQISQACGIPLSQITIGKLWSQSDSATAGSADELPNPTDFATCLNQFKAQSNYPLTGIMVWAAHMNDWSGAINYLSNTLAALSAGTSSAAPSSSSSAVPSPSSNSSSTAPAANSSSSTSASGSASAPGASQSGAASGSAGAAGASGAAGAGAAAGASGTGAHAAGASGSAAGAAAASGKPSGASPIAAASGLTLVIATVACILLF
ncbi:uncharacterized protein LOC62_03G003603 [Vanrija pseudolonga]|uniref:GH18 domain-containing protein n=1 Tax=Vanrija pseudolonga TaxID=143232 RepID=A0AAF0Y4Z6_9TREE|nr:hypothetical protein LOC62_03G003603 [Vanrija pseudolonga]